MRKRLLSIALVLVFCLSLLPGVVIAEGETVEVGDADTFMTTWNRVKDGGSVKIELKQDITLMETALTVPQEADITLSLFPGRLHGGSSQFNIVVYGKLTIIGGNTLYGGVVVENGGTLSISEGVLDGGDAPALLVKEGGSTVVTGGIFKSTTNAIKMESGTLKTLLGEDYGLFKREGAGSSKEWYNGLDEKNASTAGETVTIQRYPVRITKQPTDDFGLNDGATLTMTAGEGLTLSIEVESDAPVSYQWHSWYDGGQGYRWIQGESDQSLTFSPSELASWYNLGYFNEDHGIFCVLRCDGYILYSDMVYLKLNPGAGEIAYITPVIYYAFENNGEGVVDPNSVEKEYDGSNAVPAHPTQKDYNETYNLPNYGLRIYFLGIPNDIRNFYGLNYNGDQQEFPGQTRYYYSSSAVGSCDIIGEILTDENELQPGEHIWVEEDEKGYYFLNRRNDVEVKCYLTRLTAVAEGAGLINPAPADKFQSEIIQKTIAPGGEKILTWPRDLGTVTRWEGIRTSGDAAVIEKDGTGAPVIKVDSNTVEGATVNFTVNVVGCENYTASDATPITIHVEVTVGKRPTYTGTGPELEKNSLVYGEALNTIGFKSNSLTYSDGKSVSGEFRWESGDAKLSAGSHSCQWNFYPEDEKYAPASGKAEVTVNQRHLTVTAVQANDKIYDGSSAVVPTGLVLTGWPEGEADQILDSGRLDMTGLAVTLDSADAGSYSNAKLDGKVLPKAVEGDSGWTMSNYTIDLPEEAGFVDRSGAETNYTISKASWPVTPKGELKVSNGVTDTYTYHLYRLISDVELGEGRRLGEVEYKLGNVSFTKEGYYNSGTAVIQERSSLKLPIQSVRSTNEGEIGKVEIEITSSNYNIPLAEITVHSTNMGRPHGAPSASVTEIIYGTPLSAIELTGVMKAGEEVVEGEFVWEDPNAVPDAGEYSAKWEFIPTEQDKYVSVRGSVTITVKPAPLNGTPSFTPVTQDGKTLADVVLTAPEGWPEGAFVWTDGDETGVERGKAYGYTYAPINGNYSAYSGSVVPWQSLSAEGVELDQKALVLKVGESRRLTATVLPEDLTQDKKNVQWSSSDVSVATVDENGMVTALAVGNATITATTESGGLTATCAVTVEAEKAPSSGGGGGGGASRTYIITINPTKHGTIKASQSTASIGSNITLTVIPDSGYTLESITVADSQGTNIPVTARESGYGFTMPGRAVTVSAIFQGRTGGENPPAEDTATGCDGGSNCPSRSFTDLEGPGAWYHEAVDYVLRSGLMNGYGNDVFGPYRPLTRAQFVQILYNKEGRPAVAAGSAFSDVPVEMWCAPAVAWASARGIVKGYGDGHFGPNDTITRQQLAVMLWRYVGSPAAAEKTLSFADAAEAGAYAMEALCWASESGVLSGKSGNLLDPRGFATRAQTAQIMKNLFG